MAPGVWQTEPYQSIPHKTPILKPLINVMRYVKCGHSLKEDSSTLLTTLYVSKTLYDLPCDSKTNILIFHNTFRANKCLETRLDCIKVILLC